MRRSKKGSLNLSINAIVVLILAITMLGLGLAFMRNIFGGATEEFTKVSDTVEKQMIDQMKEGTRTVDISRPKIALKAGTTDQVFMGFKNEGNKDKLFVITTPTVSELGNPTEAQCSTGTTLNVQVRYVESIIRVTRGDTRVLPFNVEATSSATGTTCFYELAICALEVDEGAAYSGTVCGETEAETHVLELTIDVTS